MRSLLQGRMECVAEADTRGALHCQMVTPRLVTRTEQVPFTQEWTAEKVVGSKVLKFHVALIRGTEWEHQAVPEFEALPPKLCSRALVHV